MFWWLKIMWFLSKHEKGVNTEKPHKMCNALCWRQQNTVIIDHKLFIRILICSWLVGGFLWWVALFKSCMIYNSCWETFGRSSGLRRNNVIKDISELNHKLIDILSFESLVLWRNLCLKNLKIIHKFNLRQHQ